MQPSGHDTDYEAFGDTGLVSALDAGNHQQEDDAWRLLSTGIVQALLEGASNDRNHAEVLEMIEIGFITGDGVLRKAIRTKWIYVIHCPDKQQFSLHDTRR